MDLTRPDGQRNGVLPLGPEEFISEKVHGDSLIQRLGRAAMRPFRSADEVQTLAEHGQWIQHPVITGRRIAVTGVRGGSGKSTVAALVASVFARHRQDRVLAMDLDPELGSLPLRLGLKAEYSLADLARADLGTAAFQEVEPYIAHLGERLWGLPGTRGGVGGNRLDAGVYREAGIPLSRFFGVTVADCGVGIKGALHRSVLDVAHAQIMVTPATPDGAASVGQALDWMTANGLESLLRKTLVVFMVRSAPMDKAVDVNQAATILGEVGVGVVKMGFDRHMAAGAPLDYGMLAYSTRVTAIAIAAEALRRAVES